MLPRKAPSIQPMASGCAETKPRKRTLASKTAVVGIAILADDVFRAWGVGRQFESLVCRSDAREDLLGRSLPQVLVEHREDLGVHRPPAEPRPLAELFELLRRDVADVECGHA